MINPVFLWTDGLMFVLLFVVCVALFITGRDAQTRATWRQVFRRPLGVAGGLVLLFYIVIGLMDSLHFQLPDEKNRGEYQSEVISVLDQLIKPAKMHVEKTYSSPFAVHSFAKETIEQADGSQIRAYPRLQYGGASLISVHERGEHLFSMGVKVWLEWFIWTLLLLYLLSKWAGTSWKRIVMRKTTMPWFSAWVTLSVLGLGTFFIAHFMGQYHIMGTDKVGQDVLYQAIKSIRTGLVIGTLTTLIMLPFAIFLGLVAGYFRGWVDDVIQYLYTTLNSIPGVLLVASSILVLQAYIASHPEAFATLQERADMRLLFLCLILGVTSWTGLCRLLRGEALKLRQIEYVQVATALGVGRLKAIYRHLLPNVMHIVLISVVLDFSGLVLAEAFLSYVGIGVDPTMYSWGNMINAARLELSREPIVWWSLVSAFFFMFFLVLSANLFADAVRDAFDPRMQKL